MLDDIDLRPLSAGSSLLVGFVDADGNPVAGRGWSFQRSDHDPAVVRVAVSADPRVDTSLVGRRISVTGADVASLRCIQVKGTAEAVDAATDGEVEEAVEQFEALVQGILAVDGQPAELTRRMFPPAVVMVELRVDEAYDQSPGPGAGARLDTGNV